MRVGLRDAEGLLEGVPVLVLDPNRVGDLLEVGVAEAVKVRDQPAVAVLHVAEREAVGVYVGVPEGV